MIYGQSMFTLVKSAKKTKWTSRPLPVNDVTKCGSQDLNSRVKIKFDDSYFIIDTSYNTACRLLCFDTDSIDYNTVDLTKVASLIQLGDSKVYLERPNGQSLSAPVKRLVV